MRLFFSPAHTLSASFTQSDRLEQAIRPRAFPFSSGKALGKRVHTNLGTRFVPHIHLLFKFIFCLKKEFIYHMHVIKSVESIKHSHPIRYHYRPLLDLLKHPPPSITQMSKRGSVSVHSNNWSVWPVTIITFRLENTSRGTGEEKITGDSLD